LKNELKLSTKFVESLRPPSLLRSKNIKFEERKIGDGWTKEELLEHIPSARTLPQIMINGDVIGGFNDLKKLLEHDSIGYGNGEV
jgi:glutaredoxin